jgi:spermidine synthase
LIAYPFTIFSSAFLLFLVQPIIGKQLLPWFGGSPGVWIICLVFFQIALLAGYAYSDHLSKRSPKAQATIHTTLLVAAILTLPITAPLALKPTGLEEPSLRVLLLLINTVGLPYFCISSTGPLLQNWYFKTLTHSDSVAKQRVYRLFALSNLASLIGLVCYPFVLEPYFKVHHQAYAWSLGFVVFALSCILCAWKMAAKVSTRTLSNNQDDLNRRFDLIDITRWISYSALGTVCLLAVTTHLTQNIASVPFLWILPLALYLLSFILCFESDKWYRRSIFHAAVILFSPLMIAAMFKDGAAMPITQSVPLYALGLFVVCMFANGELVRLKPKAQYLTVFYLYLSVGGALGGIFVGLIAPLIFSNYWELPLALTAACFLLCLVYAKDYTRITLLTVFIFIATSWYLIQESILANTVEKAFWVSFVGLSLIFASAIPKRSLRAGVTAGAVLSLIACSFLTFQYTAAMRTLAIYLERNFFGVITVFDNKDDTYRQLKHGAIIHGVQFLDEARVRQPTSYFTETSGGALAIASQREYKKKPLHIGIIGMGVGTLATYGLTGDRITFYEIDPQVVEVANRYFSFIPNSRATTSTVVGDARLQLEKQTNQQFDVVIIDAFSSDAIPVHLITREAFAVYRRHLTKDGLIVFHVSNRYLDLKPVIAQLSNDVGWFAAAVRDYPPNPSPAKALTDYVIVAKSESLLKVPPLISQVKSIKIPDKLSLWTDDYNNLFHILR